MLTACALSAALFDETVLTHASATVPAAHATPTMLAEMGVTLPTSITPFVVLAEPEVALFATSPIVLSTLTEALHVHCFILQKKKLPAIF